MRHVVLFGLMLGAIGLCSSQLPAQPTEPKEPEYKWPKKIMGKSLDKWVILMKESKDASTRDQAIRIIPLFGPTSRQAASANLIYAIKKDKDINVRLAAIAAVPIIGFDEAFVEEGLNALTSTLDPIALQPNHTRYETTLALGNCGPIAKRAIPNLIKFTILDPSSWQNRKAACTALGQLGQPKLTEKDAGPDPLVIEALVKALRDPSHQVRREAVNALLQLGPPLFEQPWRHLRKELTESFRDSDKNVALWAHVVHIRSEQMLIKSSDPSLLAIVKFLTDSAAIVKQQEDIEAKLKTPLDSNDPGVKQDALEEKWTAIQVKQEAIQLKGEAIQALGVIGEEANSRLPDLIAIVQGTNEEPMVRAMALWAMSQFQSEIGQILPVIDPLRRGENAIIKQAAENAYKVLTDIDEKNKKNPPPKK